ncbi:MAG: DUF4111 domain-containing protein [Lachnospiraceae bacterium]|nr:DUF4111 domain-containing protein [Lachnospiraceae bacterium]
MEEYKDLLDSFVEQSKRIIGDNLVGIYLHGSAVMGCFHAQKSDIDLLIVVKDGISDETKRQYMDMVVVLNEQAPQKGIELSIVKAEVCNPFVYPTPFELHFSITHLDRYQKSPTDYIEKMKGADKDLAAHITVIYHRGKTLYGREIKTVFSEVDRADYLDSIWSDVENAVEEIVKQPMYFILNLCRVLAFKKENVILSKQEGGAWGLANIPEKYASLIEGAMTEYETGVLTDLDETLAKEYAGYMLEQIRIFD